MTTTDYVALVAFGSFGLWWLLAPRSVIRFYTWFHHGTVRMPAPIGVRIIALFASASRASPYAMPFVGIVAMRGDDLHALGYRSERASVNLKAYGGSIGFSFGQAIAMETDFRRTATASQQLGPPPPSDPSRSTAPIAEPSGKFSFRLVTASLSGKYTYQIVDRCAVHVKVGVRRNRLEVHQVDYFTPVTSLPGMPSRIGDATKPFYRSSLYPGLGASIAVTKKIAVCFDYDYTPSITFPMPLKDFEPTRATFHSLTVGLRLRM